MKTGWRRTNADDVDLTFRTLPHKTASALDDAAAAKPAAASAPGSFEEQVAYISGITPDGAITANSYWSAHDGSSAIKFGAPTAGTGGSATYAFDAASAFTATEQATFVRALAVWSSVANISFSRSASPGSADILLTRGNDGLAWADGPTSTGSGTRLGQHTGQTVISIDTSVAGFDLSGSLETAGGYGFGTAIHEIGHAIGLGHAGPYNFEVNPQQDQYSRYDSTLYSVMSYINWTDSRKYSSPNVYGWRQSADGWDRVLPHFVARADIEAAQALYGAPTTTPLDGGQIFGTKTNVEGPLASLFVSSTARPMIATLFSTGLNNVFDMRGTNDHAEINLMPGSYSSIDGLANNVGIADNTWIDAYLGGEYSDTVSGNAHDNRISGGGGDDRLYGREGDDVLLGGSGNDWFDGGSGNDDYYIHGTGNVNEDQYDAAGGFDTVYLYGTSVSIRGRVERVIVHNDRGATVIVDSANSIRITGGDGNDKLTANGTGIVLDGGAGNDVLSGGLNGDVLIGGAGADRMIGGNGNDTYWVDNVGDVVVETGRLIRGRADAIVTTLSDYQLPDVIRNLSYAGTGSATLTGNAGDNGVTGGRGHDRLYGLDGNDTLTGGGGADLLDGGTGSDRMEGGAGNDRYIVDSAGDTVIETKAGGRDVVYASVDHVLAAYVEDLVLTGAARRGTGNELGNRIEGSSGHDTLSGLGGRDVMVGGAGRDVLSGGAGADLFVFAPGDTGPGAGGADTITDFSRAARDRIDLSAFGSGLRFIGAAAFSGTAGELRQSSLGANTLLTGDLDGDGASDLAILLHGRLTLATSDFILAADQPTVVG